jgi:nicotinate-nucleotide adenylyltransferase
MKIGVFGGTFDPVHRGHTALARAAQEKFQLARLHFVPAHIPPHKQKRPITPFLHRYAMICLATAAEKSWLPSLLEAPGNAPESRPSYTVETLRRLRFTLKKADELFFLMGIDAFLDIAKWHESTALFAECAFIVASRPGHSLADVAAALPEKLRPAQKVTAPFQRQRATGDLILPGVRVHLLDSVNNNTSATAARQAAAAGRPLGKLLDPAVADYIRKHNLYRPG